MWWWIGIIALEMCAARSYFMDHPVTIGGPGKIVEIDESKFGRGKYNRGRVVDGHWIFGGAERGTRKAIVVGRSKNALLPITGFRALNI